jgi:MioC protein
MSRRVGIFVATTTGLAEICAEEVEVSLKGAGAESEIRLMEGIGAEAVDEYDLIVIVSSTYGQGDIPDSGQAFFDSLMNRNSLQGKLFTVFALGDRTYADTFCHAGEKWDALFAGKGAARVAPLERHDASSGTLAEDKAGAWAAGWSSLLKKAA